MKVKLLLIITLFSTMTTMAQEEYESLIDGDRCWSSYHKFPDTSLTRSYKEEKICGPDTLINGIRFRRLWYRQRKENEREFGEWTSSLWIGQDGGKIYSFFNTNNYSALYFLMDFSANVGDTVRTGYDDDGPDFPYKVIAVSDTILESDMTHKRRKCLHVQEIAFEKNVNIWVSGIGSLKNGIQNTGVYTYYPTLMKYSVDGEVVYQYSEDVLPIRDVLNSEEQSPSYYDLQGRRLAFPPRRGLYISDGKKISVK